MRSATALLGLFVVGSLAFNACGGDDGDDDTTAGSGGTAGSKGGGAGKGGSKPEGGESGTSPARGGRGGGTAARGGSSGRSGSGAHGGAVSDGGSGARGGTGAMGGGDEAGGASAAGGEDSVGGTAGHGGSGGVGGTTGGTSSGTAGQAGASGAGAGGEGGAEAGTGGSGPAPTAKVCAYECDGDEDCDTAHGIVCIGGECLDETRACETDTACIAWLSSMVEDCTTSTDCAYYETYGDVCVDLGGFGRCAMLPYEGDYCPIGEPNALPLFGTSGTETVCAALSGRCEHHECHNGCTSEPDFCTTRDEGGPDCNIVTGHCGGCTSNTDCDDVPGAPHCNVSTGTCECQDSGACAGIIGLPSCVAGQCSCSSEASCTKFPDAAASCR